MQFCTTCVYECIAFVIIAKNAFHILARHCPLFMDLFLCCCHIANLMHVHETLLSQYAIFVIHVFARLVLPTYCCHIKISYYTIVCFHTHKDFILNCAWSEQVQVKSWIIQYCLWYFFLLFLPVSIIHGFILLPYAKWLYMYLLSWYTRHVVVIFVTLVLPTCTYFEIQCSMFSHSLDFTLNFVWSKRVRVKSCIIQMFMYCL